MAYLGQPPTPVALTSADITDNIITAPKLNSTDVTAFIKTLLNDANADAALTTLGFSTFFKTLIDDANAATTFGNIKQDASETATGVAERATNTEALAGTDTTRFVTSANLASSKTLSTTGNYELPGRLIIQQGVHTCSGSAFNTLTFSRGFVTGVFAVVATVNSAAATAYTPIFEYGGATLTTIPAACVTAGGAFSPQQIRYIAIGV